jgi:uncharacterized membrane protein YtjA (UPF0391 family)
MKNNKFTSTGLILLLVSIVLIFAQRYIANNYLTSSATYQNWYTPTRYSGFILFPVALVVLVVALLAAAKRKKSN